MIRRIFSNTFTLVIVFWFVLAGVVIAFNPSVVAKSFFDVFTTSTDRTAHANLGATDFFEQLSESGGRLAGFVDFIRGNSAAQWFVFVSVIFAGWLLGRVASAILTAVGRKLSQRGWTARAHLPADLASPAWLAVFTLGLGAGLAALTMDDDATAVARGMLLLLYSLAAFWYVYNLVGAVEAGLISLGGAAKMKVEGQFISPIRKTLRILVVAIAVLFIVNKVFGWDVSAWLAGLGIAGLAVSLAAQDSLKNLFGSITILIDRPFRVGEQIIYGGYDGVIEEIGFRSTTVRTGDGHLVSIPNSAIVNSSVENAGRRPYIKRVLNVGVTYDTPKAKIEEAVKIIKGILEEDGIREPIHRSLGGNDYPPRVFFNDMKADSLNIFVIYWFIPPAYWDYMEHAERLNLRIFEEFERAGIEFALPTQTLYLAGDRRRRLAVEMRGRDLQ